MAGPFTKSSSDDGLITGSGAFWTDLKMFEENVRKLDGVS